MSDLDLYRIAFMEMRCLDETNEPSASDEPYAVLNKDDRIGSVQELRLTRDDLAAAKKARSVRTLRSAAMAECIA